MSPIMCVSRGPHISTMAFRSGASTFVEGASSNPAVAARAIDFAGLDGNAWNCAVPVSVRYGRSSEPGCVFASSLARTNSLWSLSSMVR